MATYIKFNGFVEQIAEKVHNLGSDVLKLYLTNTAPAAANVQYGSPPPIGAGNGYPACGITLTIAGSSQSSGTYKLDVTGCDPVFKAVGGTVGPFQYVVLYNSTPPEGYLISAWDYGSAVTLQATETFTVDFSAANGVLQIT